MSAELIIYLSGFLATFLTLIIYVCREEKMLLVEDVLVILFLSIFSWVVMGVIIIACLLDYKDTVIWRRK